MVTKKHNKICSVYFSNAETSKNNPYPKKHFGYEYQAKVKMSQFKGDH